jgi:hypothetical protein
MAGVKAKNSINTGRKIRLKQNVKRYVVENLKNSVTSPHCLTADLKVINL